MGYQVEIFQFKNGGREGGKKKFNCLKQFKTAAETSTLGLEAWE